MPYGFEFSKPVSRFEESLQVIRLLWETDGAVDFEGRFFHARSCPARHRALRGPLPAASGSAPTARACSTSRAATPTAGGRPTSGRPRTTRPSWRVLRASADRAGRDPDAIVPALILTCFIGERRRTRRDPAGSAGEGVRAADPRMPSCGPTATSIRWVRLARLPRHRSRAAHPRTRRRDARRRSSRRRSSPSCRTAPRSRSRGPPRVLRRRAARAQAARLRRHGRRRVRPRLRRQGARDRRRAAATLRDDARDGRTRLDATALLAAAQATTGLADWGDPTLPDRFAIAVDLIRSRGMDDGGRSPAPRRSPLAAHRPSAVLRRPRPLGLGDEVVDRPLFVTGEPRSGTTLLHALLRSTPARGRCASGR